MKLKIAVLNLIMSVAFLNVAHAQSTNPSASVNFQANASIAAAISLANTASLNFGNIVPGTGGTVEVSATGTRTVAGGVVASGGTVNAATFTVTGTPSTAYTITLPASASLTGPGESMSVTFPVTDVTGGTLSHTTNASGTDTFASGGILTVANAQPSGSYAGTFTMTVGY